MPLPSSGPGGLAERYESPERFGIIMQRESLVDIFTACAPPTATMIPLAAAAFPIKTSFIQKGWGGGGGEGWRHSDMKNVSSSEAKQADSGLSKAVSSSERLDRTSPPTTAAAAASKAPSSSSATDGRTGGRKGR